MLKDKQNLTHPYKFFDYYGIEDRNIFFGREREIEILISDIVTTRLVVLFAKTGCGKTSLINAGVRPRLEELDYATFYVRVEKDPTESVKEKLREKNLLPTIIESETLETQLEYAVKKLKKPLVLFFDQFEEFFIYISNKNSEKTNQFISNIAKIYRNSQSGVHIIFSMREEFFIEMDVFRDEIPSIFHYDSNLRLHWFDANQARDAVVLPAQMFETEIEEILVKHLIDDLSEAGRIEPARLQIVCDTLWKEKSNNRILHKDYERLGGATRIIDRRIEKDIDQNLDEKQLRLFEMLLPELITERRTKYIRGFDELVKTLKTDDTSFRKLVTKLKKLHLLRESRRYDAIYIEWTSDYLAERTNYFQNRVRVISLRRLLKAAIDRAEMKKKELGVSDKSTIESRLEPSTTEDIEALNMRTNDFDEISIGSNFLKDLTKAEAEFIFIAALQHGNHLRLWFQIANQCNVEVWKILENRITYWQAQSNQTVNAIQLLSELRDSKKALKLLEVASQRDVLATQVINVLRQMGTKEAIDLLAKMVQQEGPFSLRAGTALNSIASVKSDDEELNVVIRHANAALNDILKKQADSLFLLALEQGLDMPFWFKKAVENNVEVWEILRAKIINKDIPIEQAENSVRLLGTLGTQQALKLLDIALQQDMLSELTITILKQIENKEVVEFWKPKLQQTSLTSQAERALERILESRTAKPEVKADVTRVLNNWRMDRGITVVQKKAGIAQKEIISSHRGLDKISWEKLLRQIQYGEFTPFLGPGINFGILPTGSDLARKLAQQYDYPSEDATDLSRVAQYIGVKYDKTYPKELVMEQVRNVTPPDFTASDDIHSIFADLPLPLYITTNYDTFMERALVYKAKNPYSESLKWNIYIKGQTSKYDSNSNLFHSPANPVVFHMYGRTEEVDSLVISEGDYLDYLVNLSSDDDLIPYEMKRKLASTAFLFIGYSLSDWSFQVLFRSLAKFIEMNIRPIHIMQIVEPSSSWTQYSLEYFEKLRIKVYEGTAKEFAIELRERWRAFSDVK